MLLSLTVDWLQLGLWGVFLLGHIFNMFAEFTWISDPLLCLCLVFVVGNVCILYPRRHATIHVDFLLVDELHAHCSNGCLGIYGTFYVFLSVFYNFSILYMFIPVLGFCHYCET